MLIIVFEIEPPSPKNMHHCFDQFEETGCLFKGKNSGWPCISDKNLQIIHQAFEWSPVKLTRHASRELIIPHTTVWSICVLRWCLVYKPYRLQLVQVLHVGDKREHVESCSHLLMDKTTDFYCSWFLAMMQHFMLAVKLNVIMCAFRDSRILMKLKVQVRFAKSECFLCISQVKIYHLFFFEENWQEHVILKWWRSGFFLQLHEGSDDFIFQQAEPCHTAQQRTAICEW